MRGLLKWFSFLYCSYAISVSAAANNDGVRMPRFERVILRNGVTLLLMERHDVPLIAVDASLRGGAVTDAPGKFGAAQLLSQWLLKGAGARNAEQFAEDVAAVGGSIDASASLEAITVDGEFMSRDQQLMVELLRDVLLHPHLDDNEFVKLRDRQIEFLRAEKDSNLDALLPIYAASALFGTHPYGHPIAGDETSLRALDAQDVKRVYEQQLGADRLVIAVAGDFETAKLKQQLTKAFGEWRAAGVGIAAIPAPTPSHGRRVVLIDAPDSVQSYFWIGNVGISRSDPHRVALDLVNTLFGGRFTSLLNSELRIKSGLTYGARAKLSEYLQPGSWSMRSFTKTESTVTALDMALRTYAKLRHDGLDDAALDSGKRYVLGQFPLHFETAAQWAGAMADLEFYGLPPSEIDAYAMRLHAVTSLPANRALRESLPDSNDLLMVVIGNATQLRDALKKYGPLKELKLSAPTFVVAASVAPGK